VSLLLELGADIEAKDSRLGMSAAHVAAVFNSQALIMEDLLERGVPLEGKDNNGNTPLLRAAINDREAVLRCLLANGADPEALNMISPLTPVLHAICNHHSTAAMCLLKYGVNHNAMNNTGWHGVHMAANHGVRQALSFYIEKGYLEVEVGGACPAASRGLRALHLAVREGNEECVRVLLASGAGLEHRTCLNEYTPFLLVAEPRFGSPPKTTITMLSIAKKLCAANADIFALDKRGRNALFGAAVSGALELIDFLVQKGLQLDIVDYTGNTLVHAATENDQKKTLEYLLKKGVDVCTTNDSGTTALHLAVNKCNCTLVRLLVGASAKAVEIYNNAGKTPFDEAVKLAAQYDGPEEFQPKRSAIPQMSRDKARQNIKDIVDLFHSVRGTKDVPPTISNLSRRATEPVRRIT
jgi:ankyrin repeat protein